MITLKTLSEATAQEVFDQCALHLLTQNEKSYDGRSSRCRYHHRQLRCAAGCFISTTEYKVSMEKHAWRDLTETDRVPDTHARLIGNLQMIHDNKKVIDWADDLINLAKHENLQIPHFLSIQA